MSQVWGIIVAGVFRKITNSVRDVSFGLDLAISVFAKVVRSALRTDACFWTN